MFREGRPRRLVFSLFPWYSFAFLDGVRALATDPMAELMAEVAIMSVMRLRLLDATASPRSQEAILGHPSPEGVLDFCTPTGGPTKQGPKVGDLDARHAIFSSLFAG